MKNKLLVLIILFSGLYFSGCRVLQPNKMLKSGKNYVYDKIPEDTVNLEYRIAPEDLLQISLYSNDGFKMLENMEGGATTNVNANTQQGMSYPVEFDGVINLPILGRLKVAGLTARECESFIEEKYSEFYINPYVILKITNRKVIIFPGAPGAAQVLQLTSGQTTLLEALALAGGIRGEGKAYSIKLIRGDVSNPEVFLIDLSKIENLKQANMVLESDDIIYIEQRYRPLKEIMAEITPVTSFITTMTSFFLSYYVIKRYTK